MWFGDECGPFVLKTDRSDKVLAVFDTKVDGNVVLAPLLLELISSCGRELDGGTSPLANGNGPYRRGCTFTR